MEAITNSTIPSNHSKQIAWLIIIISVLTIAVLVGAYSWVAQLSLGKAVFELIRYIIPGFIGALIAYLVGYFVFVRRGISVNLDQQREMIKGIQEDLTVSSSGPVIRGLLTKIKKLQPPFGNDLKLYTFYGLQGESHSDMLQDFDMSGTNVNAVQFLWSDASAGNTIEAKVKMDPDGPYLHISFDNKSSAGSNIAIRASGDKAHLKPRKMRYMTFDMKVAQGHEQVVVGFRVVNGWLQHWHYANMPDSFRTKLLGRHYEWTAFSIDLEEAGWWHLFKSDGNYLYGPDEADFSIITSIIFECGVSESGHEGALSPRPGRGKGELSIRRIRFTETSENLI